MKINTSYYANLKKITSVPIGISSRMPEWYKGEIYTTLAPPTELVLAYKSGRIDSKKYTAIFNSDVLGELDASAIVAELQSLGESVTLLCYEKAGEFCHRRLVATWLESELGIKVPELGYECNLRKLF
jgi:hypothetical protein